MSTNQENVSKVINESNTNTIAKANADNPKITSLKEKLDKLFLDQKITQREYRQFCDRLNEVTELEIDATVTKHRIQEKIAQNHYDTPQLHYFTPVYHYIPNIIPQNISLELDNKGLKKIKQPSKNNWLTSYGSLDVKDKAEVKLQLETKSQKENEDPALMQETEVQFKNDSFIKNAEKFCTLVRIIKTLDNYKLLHNSDTKREKLEEARVIRELCIYFNNPSYYLDSNYIEQDDDHYQYWDLIRLAVGEYENETNNKARQKI